MTAAQSWVWLARIRRPQGRKGEVYAEILTDFPEKFAERKQLWLVSDDSGGAAPQHRRRAPANPDPLPMDLTSHWLHKGGIVLHFAGVDSISAAETLAGKIVAIPQSERATLPEDETYISDLIGCELVDIAGGAPVAVGRIEDVDRTAGPVALLVVHGARGEVLVPFAQKYLRRLDLAAKTVEMDLPEGLLDLNAPRADRP
jgi:16S rRNA processing protein RimM